MGRGLELWAAPLSRWAVRKARYEIDEEILGHPRCLVGHAEQSHPGRGVPWLSIEAPSVPISALDPAETRVARISHPHPAPPWPIGGSTPATHAD